MTRQVRVLVAGIAMLAVGVTLAALVVSARIAAPPLSGASAEETAAPAPRFIEEAMAAGLRHAYDGELTFFVGGGVAILDCDANDRPDLYLAGGAEPAALFRNVSERGGRLAFEAVPSEITDLDRVTGAYPLDVDADRIGDLVVLRQGENVLLRGNGDCGFERANEAWGVDGGDAWTAAFSATWEEGSAWPSLAFGNYLVLDDEGRSTATCDGNVLLRPLDSGGYAEPIALEPGWCSLSMLFSDWDRSGRRDLRVSNDRHYYRDGSEQLWRIETGADPVLWSEEEGWQALRIFGMGIASRDLTADGYPEVFLTSQGDNKLQTLAGDPARPEYVDIALRRGATAHRPYAGDTTMPSTAWHPEFADVNNDGFVDLFVTKGNVEAQTDFAMRDPSNLLIGQPAGTFVEGAEEAGIVSYERARGAGIADLNLDGLLDLVVVNRRENVSLWRNLGAGEGDAAASMGHWLMVDPVQPGGNRNAVGAWVEVRAGERTWSVERTVGGGHVSGQLGAIHVGLGEAEQAEVRIIWPDGEAGEWQEVAADAIVTIDRESDEMQRRLPGEPPP